MPSQVIGEWTDKHQKAIEAWCDRVVERLLREELEAEKKAREEIAK